MRRTYLLLVFCVAQTMLFAGVALGQETSFSDDFTYFDTIRWSRDDHMLGRSYLDPTNVDGQNLRIKLPAPSKGARSSPTNCTVTAHTAPA